MTINKLALVAAISSLLAACGGSDSNDSSSSSSSSMSSSSVSSSAASSSAGPGEYDGNWASCERLNTPQGFATRDGGITGGADVGAGHHEVGVTTGSQLQNTLNDSEYEDLPLTIYVDDLITWENSNGGISIRRNDVTIIGRSENAGFEGVGLELSHGATNIIIRHLEMRYVPQSNGTGDLISMNGTAGAVSNVWIDHNELYNSLEAPEDAGCGLDESCNKDYYDELVSGRGAVHNVTISYNYMHDSWKTSLWGSSDNAEEEDVGRTITFHHNYWHNVNSRLPLFRFGEGHVFNNYYHDVTGSGINSRMGAEMRIDGNVFENVKAPIVSIDSSERGFWDVEDNIFENISADGNCPTTGSECRGAQNESTTSYIPDYTYDIMPAEDVKAYVLEYSGPGALTSCLDLPEPEGNVEAPEFITDPQDPPEAWSIYNGDLAPDADGSLSLEDGSSGSFTLGGSSEAEHFTVNGDGTIAFDTSEAVSLSQNGTLRGVLPEGYPKHLTVLAGVQGVNEDIRLLEIETAFSDEGEAGSRLKTVLRNQEGAVGIQLEDGDPANDASPDYYDQLDMTEYHVYQISVTMNNASRGNVRVFVDGNDEPVISLLDVEMRAASSDGDNFVRIGDGSSGHAYKSTVDWVVWTTESDYLPSDLKGALPESLGDITGYEAE